MDDQNQIRQRLEAVFKEDELEWRVQSSGKKQDGSAWLRVLTYVTNRAIMTRLDDVFGVGGWKNEFRIEEFNADVEEKNPMTEKMEERRKPITAIICGISCLINNGNMPGKPEWVTRWDCSEPTQVEPAKGGFSASMKRAANQWGIGRYLYDLEAGYAIVSDNGVYSSYVAKIGAWVKWNPPALPTWALPSNHPDQPRAAAPAAAPAAKAPATNPMTDVQEAPAGGRTPMSKGAPAATPVSSARDWRQVTVHFGKNKGKRLGDLPDNSLSWYIDSYAVKENASPADTELRAALDVARDEFAKRNGSDGMDQRPPEERPQAKPTGERPPTDTERGALMSSVSDLLISADVDEVYYFATLKEMKIVPSDCPSLTEVPDEIFKRTKANWSWWQKRIDDDRNAGKIPHASQPPA